MNVVESLRAGLEVLAALNARHVDALRELRTLVDKLTEKVASYEGELNQAASERADAVLTLQALRERIEARIDHHDVKQSEADAMDFSDSARWHESVRKELQDLLSEDGHGHSSTKSTG